ncbi:uncharacterized protein LOC124795597 [Schistocerca piceifrons]|uniref:uncharacterized protein LOC124795597 n=1 Tax=Schistocerca piceifrons TaxID=274613 RepID=UPI001F5FAEAF|nr:uncharacterized protein LOC124795597 [Schistocerca piceifrons]
MHTSHGLRLNYHGKQFLAEEICRLVNKSDKKHKKIAGQSTLEKWITREASSHPTRRNIRQPHHLNDFLLPKASLSNKVEELNILLMHELEDISVMCLSEHWLDKNLIKSVCLHNYTLAECYCRPSGHYGGVAIYVKDNTEFTKIDNVTSLSCEKDFEMTVIKIPKLGLIIATVYHSPTGKFEVFLEKMEIFLNKLHKTRCDVVVCGDFNIDLRSKCKQKTALGNLIKTHNLTATVKVATRITPTSQTGLDQILIDKEKLESSVKVFNRGYSDHKAQIHTTTKEGRPVENNLLKVKRRIYRQKSIDHFNSLLHTEDWSDVYEKQNLNSKFNIFLEKMVKHFDTAFPQKMVNIREKTRGKGWITKGIRTSCQKKRELHIMCKENNATEEMHTHYKTYTKILQKVIKLAKRVYNDYYINNSTNKVKAMWDIIKKETGKNKRAEENIVLIHNNKKILQPTETANIFKKYFTGIAENLIKTNFSSTQHQVVNKCNSDKFSMFVDQVSREETLKAVRELKTTYSAGIDESGIFPDQLKTSKVIPIFKAGDKDEVINYHPITLTSCFSKVIMCTINEDIQEEVNTVTKHLSNWTAENQLMINYNQTVALNFHNHQNTTLIYPEIKINQHPVWIQRETTTIETGSMLKNDHLNMYLALSNKSNIILYTVLHMIKGLNK